jgi:hypothetical protein
LRSSEQCIERGIQPVIARKSGADEWLALEVWARVLCEPNQETSIQKGIFSDEAKTTCSSKISWKFRKFFDNLGLPMSENVQNSAACHFFIWSFLRSE